MYIFHFGDDAPEFLSNFELQEVKHKGKLVKEIDEYTKVYDYMSAYIAVFSDYGEDEKGYMLKLNYLSLREKELDECLVYADIAKHWRKHIADLKESFRHENEKVISLKEHLEDMKTKEKERMDEARELRLEIRDLREQKSNIEREFSSYKQNLEKINLWTSLIRFSLGIVLLIVAYIAGIMH